MVNFENVIEYAYKKLKSSVYFDKTQLILRNRLVEYETRGDAINEKLSRLQSRLNNLDINLITDICNTIDCLVYPKALEEKERKNLVSNVPQGKVQVKDFQYMMYMDVEGYILGIAWILLIGSEFDNNVYKHSYGNRLRRTSHVINSEKSPYLFQPYYTQYESWRDTGLKKAKEALSDGSDVVIMTMDIKRFFYSVDIDGEHLLEVVENMIKSYKYKNSRGAIKFLTEFVIKSIETYSEKLRAYDGELIGTRNVLPIGFHPSNLLSNFCLKKFDEAIADGWTPLYYGRYVDDIIIVETVSKNSKIRELVTTNELTANGVINYYMTGNGIWQKNFDEEAEGLLVFNDKEQTYYVNNVYNEFKKSKFELKDDKIHIFYFDAAHTDALITCFQKNLTKNVSEFRYMPEDELVFSADDYSDIYKLTETSTPNKISGISDFCLDSYRLSKFLGKYMRISSLITDEAENRFEKDIEKIFTDSAIIAHYTVWEKVISIFVYNNRFKAAETFINKVCEAIQNIDCEGSDKADSYKKMKDCFIGLLTASMNKSYSLVWGRNAKKSVSNIKQKIAKNRLQINRAICAGTIMRRHYILSRMCDKTYSPLLVDGFINNGKIMLDDNSNDVNLTRFSEDLINHYNPACLNEQNYKYYPYIITMSDIAVYKLIAQVKDLGSKPKIESEEDEDLNSFYIKINFGESNTDSNAFNINAGQIKKLKPGENNISRRAICVGGEKKDKIKIAVGNIKLCEDDFNHALEHRPNRTKERYFGLVKMVNAAIREKADMLVLPESYLPFEWLPTLARTCAKNQLAVVTGIEHFTVKNNCGNFTAVILPYTEGEYKFCYTFFHAKVHMAPHEERVIVSHGFRAVEGSGYELYCWNGFWFPVYCCYELTSITDRAIFQSYADAVVAIEWNKDVNYYSNIVESLSRDLHCYLVQVNTADYGDSRVTQPSKTENRDILKVKGGINPAIFVDELDISKLRDFQIKGTDLQQSDENFKVTPPGFRREIIQHKIDGTLWDNLK